jgi:hypothetical protein
VAPTAAATPRLPPGVREPVSQSSGGAATSAPLAEILRPLLVGLAVLLVLGILLLLYAVRWLMGARDVPRIWRRLVFLADRLKVPRRSGDTPQEFGVRLGDSVPELDREFRRLAELYTRSSFRRGGLTMDELAEARRLWARVRGRYAGLVAGAWRDALRNGRVVSAEEAAASRNREPSARHRPAGRFPDE